MSKLTEYIDRKTYWLRVWCRKHFRVEVDMKAWGIGIAWLWDASWTKGIGIILGPFEIHIGRVR